MTEERFEPKPAAVERLPVFIDEFLWRSLFEGPPPDLEIPAGFHDASALQRLISEGALFSGLVVSLAAAETLGGLQNFLLALMRPQDFACRENGEQFLLICPGLTGINAWQHLNLLSERLWDFQLRAPHTSLENVPFLLSVGGFDVERESVADAIASARERMTQTRRAHAAYFLSRS